MLFLGGRQPAKILVARDSGRVFQADMMPLYNDKWVACVCFGVVLCSYDA